MTESDYVSDFEFDGTWREFAGIALVNLLLTVATLGIYRFWAKTRVRRYLWSRTMFMGDRLEWAGTGAELFRGGVIALLLFFLPVALANFGIKRVIAHGHPLLGLALTGVELLVIYVLVGIGLLRALRYRLSRTHWRGIRGGSFDQGLGFGLAYAWKNALAMVTLGVMLPWAMASLWNQRWRAMSFGPWPFAANGRARRLWLPFLICYLAPAAAVGVIALIIKSGMTVTFFGIEPETPLQWILIRLPALFGFLFVFTLIIMAYYASFFAQMIEATALNEMSFRFNAGATEWMELYVVDVLVVVGTLGVGWLFIPYRHWTFYLRHFQCYGRLDPDTMSQSTTPAPSQGEGLLDAFDMGAL